eukprot:6873419-Lingulodinium_polyedra.AAC.1
MAPGGIVPCPSRATAGHRGGSQRGRTPSTGWLNAVTRRARPRQPKGGVWMLAARKEARGNSRS